ncbi:uncharacterized protein V1510DRAFT_215325 [Dipodascopsis tothii]|uniref:uncharacterized protein n=1 Tax=Dipodascopsis tothii TaxID=44089 RepID=UPI0034CD5334
MRDVNFNSFINSKAAVNVTSGLYDRRALDCTSDKPLINSLNHLTYLTSSSARIRESLTLDGGVERLIAILKDCKGFHSKDPLMAWKWTLAFQCLVSIGVRGTETVRRRVVEADIVPVIATVLDNFLEALDKLRMYQDAFAERNIGGHPIDNHLTHTHSPAPSVPASIMAPSDAADADAAPARAHRPRTHTRRHHEPTEDAGEGAGDNEEVSSNASSSTAMLRYSLDVMGVGSTASATTSGPTSAVASGAPSPTASAHSANVEILDQSTAMNVDDRSSPFEVVPTESESEDAVTAMIQDAIFTDNGVAAVAAASASRVNSASDPSARPAGEIHGRPHNLAMMNPMIMPTIEDGDSDVATEAAVETAAPNLPAAGGTAPADPRLANNAGRSSLFPTATDNSGAPQPADDAIPPSPLNMLASSLFGTDFLLPREEDVLWSLQLLAYVSKYTYLRPYFQQTHIVPGLSVRANMPALAKSSGAENEGEASSSSAKRKFNRPLAPANSAFCPASSAPPMSTANPNTTTGAAHGSAHNPLAYTPSPAFGTHAADQENINTQRPARRPPQPYCDTDEMIVDSLGAQPALLPDRATDDADDMEEDMEFDAQDDKQLKHPVKLFTDPRVDPELDDDLIDDEYKMPIINVFPLVERFTVRTHPSEMQYWAGVIMRNSCRKDELRGGIRQCACFDCGKWEEFPRQFAKCRRCRRTKYCSKSCQSKAWYFHRHWCVSAA